MALTLKDIDVDTMLVILDELEMTSSRSDRSISAQELATRLIQRNANLRCIPVEQVLAKVIQLMNEAHRLALCQIPAKNFYVATQVWEELSADDDSDSREDMSDDDEDRHNGSRSSPSSKHPRSSSQNDKLRESSRKRKRSGFGKAIRPNACWLIFQLKFTGLCFPTSDLSLDRRCIGYPDPKLPDHFVEPGPDIPKILDLDLDPIFLKFWTQTRTRRNCHNSDSGLVYNIQKVDVRFDAAAHKSRIQRLEISLKICDNQTYFVEYNISKSPKKRLSKSGVRRAKLHTRIVRVNRSVLQEN
uniref:Uncharacterized protein n=1 Tax=Romanomermis culicivorax TaxID=13658 RepID=A0A915J7B1_ROMCU